MKFLKHPKYSEMLLAQMHRPTNRASSASARAFPATLARLVKRTQRGTKKINFITQENFQLYYDMREHVTNPCDNAIREIVQLSKATINNLRAKVNFALFHDFKNFILEPQRRNSARSARQKEEHRWRLNWRPLFSCYTLNTRIQRHRWRWCWCLCCCSDTKWSSCDSSNSGF